MAAVKANDLWSSGDAYEPYIGRWSRIVGRHFLDWLAEPPDLRWLDVGCGTGVLSQVVLEHGLASQVLGIDPSDGFIAYARAKEIDPRVNFRLGSADRLPVHDGVFDVAVSGLVLNFLPEPAKGVAEMRRAVRPGGTVAAYVWDYAEGMQLMRHFWDAAVALDPAAAELDEGKRFPLAKAEPLAALFEAGGFQDVETDSVEVETLFADFDDYWTPFLGGAGPAPGYCAGLDPEARAALRERLAETLPIEPDGSIKLMARAWAVRGTVPE
ncbi:MAG TPA: class I SAM-dependent methyltransferase [Kiloniellales bacterium]|nr:class I SAM-dependent methyltransferase [Kiloniellales bacterium]